jgi:ESS family glutamate:Na+ symporter
MFVDFAIVSALLVFSHLLRSRIRLLQDLFVPAPIIAGFLGLLGSEQVLGVLPFHHAEDGEVAMSTYPFELVAILFATLYMGHRPRRPSVQIVFREVGDTFFYNLAAEIGQYAFALLFGVAVLAPLFPQLPSGFAVMLPAGFVGGHGTATVIGKVLAQQGWDEALSIGYTFATVGLLAGIFGGLLLINLAARLGWCRHVGSSGDLPDLVKRGFIPPEKQTPLGSNTVSTMVLDPLAWHFALVLCAFGGAHLINAVTKQWFPGDYTLPLFAVAMLVGVGLQALLEAVDLGQFVDRQVMTRIGSSVTDYLIVFGVASIKISVVLDYAAPLAVMSLFGVTYAVAMLWLLGRRIFQSFWFERSIFVYGWSTGIVAIGILLLRIVDPRMRSRTLEDYGLAYVGISPLEIVLLVVLPPLIAREIIIIPAIVLVCLFAVCIVMSSWLVGWCSLSPDETRPGEEEGPSASIE